MGQSNAAGLCTVCVRDGLDEMGLGVQGPGSLVKERTIQCVAGSVKPKGTATVMDNSHTLPI